MVYYYNLNKRYIVTLKVKSVVILRISTEYDIFCRNDTLHTKLHFSFSQTINEEKDGDGQHRDISRSIFFSNIFQLNISKLFIIKLLININFRSNIAVVGKNLTLEMILTSLQWMIWRVWILS